MSCSIIEFPESPTGDFKKGYNLAPSKEITSTPYCKNGETKCRVKSVYLCRGNKWIKDRTCKTTCMEQIDGAQCVITGAGPTCSETDKGMDALNFGITTVRSPNGDEVNYEDFCHDKEDLEEYFCTTNEQEGNIGWSTRDCDDFNAVCRKGQCVPL